MALNNRRKPDEPDMSRPCYVNFGYGSSKYCETYTEAVEFCKSIESLNLQPIRIYDYATLKNVTSKLLK